MPTTLRIIPFLFSILSATLLFGQAGDGPKKTTLSVTQLIQKIQQSPNDTVRLFDLRIVPDPNTDARFLTDVRGTENWDSLSASYDTILIDKMVMLIDVHFAASVVSQKCASSGCCTWRKYLCMVTSTSVAALSTTW